MTQRQLYSKRSDIPNMNYTYVSAVTGVILVFAVIYKCLVLLDSIFGVIYNVWSCWIQLLLLFAMFGAPGVHFCC